MQRPKAFAHAIGKKLQLGVWGAYSLQWVKGRALVGAQGAKPPEAQRIQAFRTT